MRMAFDSDEVARSKLRERLRKMSDAEVIIFGQEVLKACRESSVNGNWKRLPVPPAGLLAVRMYYSQRLIKL